MRGDFNPEQEQQDIYNAHMLAIKVICRRCETEIPPLAFHWEG